jgi:hypothetical protein
MFLGPRSIHPDIKYANSYVKSLSMIEAVGAIVDLDLDDAIDLQPYG